MAGKLVSDIKEIRRRARAHIVVAEGIAIESYAEMVRYTGDDDPTTRRMPEDILAKEEEHADDLGTLLERLSGDRADR